MGKATSDVAREFDSIASALAETPPSRTFTAAECAVLTAIPASARSALEVGCGDGRLARAIARRNVAVTAIDVSTQMIALARARTTPEERIDYRVADVMHIDTLAPSYDVVVSVNTVHHVPLSLIIPRLAALVAPGGTLVIQDVVTRPGLRYLPLNLVAAVWTRGRWLTGRDRISRRVRFLYEQHGRDETYLEPSAAVEAFARYLPGACVVHHLAWRYTAIWHRPGGNLTTADADG